MIVRLAGTPPPLTPDGGQARRWAEQELRDPAYAAAHPTPIDRMARAVQDFFVAIFSARAEGAWAVWLAAAVAVVLIALIVAAVVLSGRPRLSRRTDAPADLFGDVETRSAARLRRAADDAVAAADWGQAIVLRQRALARGLTERGAVQLVPGATVHAFARAAASAFPACATMLDAAAGAFDDVRYLRREGTAAMYAVVAGADDAVRAGRPVHDEQTIGIRR